MGCGKSSGKGTMKHLGSLKEIYCTCKLLDFITDGNEHFSPPRHCLDLLEEFNRAHGTVVQKPPSMEQAESNKSDKRSGRRTGPIQLSRNLDRLETLLNIVRLKSELRDLTEASQSSQPKPYFATSSTATMVSTWTDHNRIHSVLGSYGRVLSDDQCAVAGIHLYRLLHSVQILPSLVLDSQKLAVILSAQHWEMCRSLMVVFDWCRDAGPSTAKRVLDIHRTQGYAELKTQSPMLADLVDHIVWYVREEQEAWIMDKKKQKSQKRRKGIIASYTDSRAQEPAEGCPNFGPRPPQLKELPQDLYGLCSNKTAKQTIKLPELRTFGGGYDELYSRSNAVIQDIWTAQLIIPSLKPIDKMFSSTRRKTADDRDILDRCLTRGAILQSMADACGTDAIFASTAIKEFLASPSLVFETRLQRDNTFAKYALNDAVSTLNPLFEWITARIKETPEICEVAQQIGDIIHLRMVELSTGTPLLPGQMESTTQPLVESGVTKAAPRKAGQKRIFSEVSPASLLPGHATVGIGVFGLIVREALAARRGFHTTTDEVLRRVLKGKHATQSSTASHNPDHTDPIRQFSVGAELLYRHLPGFKLTSETGLSNLLSWLGTGQGFVTQSFLKTVEPDGFYKSDVEAMVNQFKRAVSSNWHYMDQHTSGNSKAKSKSRSPKFPERIVTHDVRIWGQPSNHLALTPTHTSGANSGSHYTLDEKFSQYFPAAVQERWKEALGDMLNQDPAMYSGQKRPWDYYHRMVKELNIPGFQQGLTVFQLSNYLVFLGIATMPSCSEVAEFISENRQKGAFRGLEKLGFHMVDLSHVQSAFYCIHHHLDQHLTEDDKKILGFSPILTEHLLCKVVRWADHLRSEGDMDFYQMGLSAESTSPNCEWEAGLNLTDNTAFPFPLTITSEQLAMAIKDTGVSTCSSLHISDG